MDGTADERYERMRAIRDDVFNFRSSPLYEERTRNTYYPVIGQGSHYANIMFVGEAPGKNEAMTSVPFCGAAGKILDSLLESVGLERKKVYITNIVKDRPPGNRDPLPSEIEAYAPFLDRQIDIIRPDVIVPLGRFSMNYIMQKFGIGQMARPISAIHGTVFDAEAPYGPIHIIPMYHPAASLYNQHLRDVLKNDFQAIKPFIHP